MSIATEITRLQNAKSSIKTAIEGKGVEVPSTTKLDGYGELITSIPSGGDTILAEGDITITSDSNTISISHSLGSTPYNAMIYYKGDTSGFTNNTPSGQILYNIGDIELKKLTIRGSINGNIISQGSNSANISNTQVTFGAYSNLKFPSGTYHYRIYL